MDAGDLRSFVNGKASPILNPAYSCADAYAAARSARFEHGERGPMP
jgi:hypothetical protein